MLQRMWAASQDVGTKQIIILFYSALDVSTSKLLPFLMRRPGPPFVGPASSIRRSSPPSVHLAGIVDTQNHMYCLKSSM